MKKGKKVIYVSGSDNGKGWSQVEANGITGWVMNKHLKKKNLSKFKTKTLKENKSAIRIRKNKKTEKTNLKANKKYKLICKISKGKYKDYKYIGIGKKRYYIK